MDIMDKIETNENTKSTNTEKKRGRVNITGIDPKDTNYFNKYYHQTKETVICACGAELSHKKMARHLQRNVHTKRMDRINKMDK